MEENRISIKGEEYDLNPNIQTYFTNTKHTTKPMANEGKLTVFNIIDKIGFYSIILNKGLNSACINDALNIVPKAMAKIRNPPLR